jgi:hypothetical protein
VQPFFEVAVGADQHVRRNPRPTQGVVSQAAPATLLGSIVGNDHEQVVVAVRTGLSPRGRPEEIDALGLVLGHEAFHHLGQISVLDFNPAHPASIPSLRYGEIAAAEKKVKAVREDLKRAQKDGCLLPEVVAARPGRRSQLAD